MKERQLEIAYRSRFDGARQGEQALPDTYDDRAAAFGEKDFAVLVGAARPRTRRSRTAPRDDVVSIIDQATLVTRWRLAGADKYSPLEDSDLYSARPTLGGRYLPPSMRGNYREAHAVLLNDGSVGLSWRAGNHERDNSGKNHDSNQIPTSAVQGFAAALIALVHAVSTSDPAGYYDIILGVDLYDLAGLPPDFRGPAAAPPYGVHRTLSGRFRQVRATVDSSVDDASFIRSAIDVATSALNQVGVTKPNRLDTTLPPRPSNWTW